MERQDDLEEPNDEGPPDNQQENDTDPYTQALCDMLDVIEGNPDSPQIEHRNQEENLLQMMPQLFDDQLEAIYHETQQQNEQNDVEDVDHFMMQSSDVQSSSSHIQIVVEPPNESQQGISNQNGAQQIQEAAGDVSEEVSDTERPQTPDEPLQQPDLVLNPETEPSTSAEHDPEKPAPVAISQTSNERFHAPSIEIEKDNQDSQEELLPTANQQIMNNQIEPSCEQAQETVEDDASEEDMEVDENGRADSIPSTVSHSLNNHLQAYDEAQKVVEHENNQQILDDQIQTLNEEPRETIENNIDQRHLLNQLQPLSEEILKEAQQVIDGILDAVVLQENSDNQLQTAGEVQNVMEHEQEEDDDDVVEESEFRRRLAAESGEVPEVDYYSDGMFSDIYETDEDAEEPDHANQLQAVSREILEEAQQVLNEVLDAVVLESSEKHLHRPSGQPDNEDDDDVVEESEFRRRIAAKSGILPEADYYSDAMISDIDSDEEDEEVSEYEGDISDSEDNGSVSSFHSSEHHENTVSPDNVEENDPDNSNVVPERVRNGYGDFADLDESTDDYDEIERTHQDNYDSDAEHQKSLSLINQVRQKSAARLYNHPESRYKINYDDDDVVEEGDFRRRFGEKQSKTHKSQEQHSRKRTRSESPQSSNQPSTSQGLSQKRRMDDEYDGEIISCAVQKSLQTHRAESIKAQPSNMPSTSTDTPDGRLLSDKRKTNQKATHEDPPFKPTGTPMQMLKQIARRIHLIPQESDCEDEEISTVTVPSPVDRLSDDNTESSRETSIDATQTQNQTIVSKEAVSKNSRFCSYGSAPRARKFFLMHDRVIRKYGNDRILKFRQENVVQTIRLRFEAAKKFMKESEAFYDEFVPVVLENHQSERMLNFGRLRKNYTCKQMRRAFLHSWWRCDRKSPLKQGIGLFPKPKDCVYTTLMDPRLYGQHYQIDPKQSSQLEKISDLLRPRLNATRMDNEIIPDSSYFVREFYLNKSEISFRVASSFDLPDCFVPPTLNAGYFPSTARTERERMDYLFSRYQEAQKEYQSLTYRSITPPRGFRVCPINVETLYVFHCMGKHIHGFFVCWESETEDQNDAEGRGKRKRYLVDIFLNMMFPIDINYARWDTRLKIAFDKTSTYLLHLSEICRINRPVFDKLSRNSASFLRPVPFENILETIRKQNVDPYNMMRKVGPEVLYKHGLTTANKNYLSKFLIISGGSKKMRRRNVPVPPRIVFEAKVQPEIICISSSESEIEVIKVVNQEKVHPRVRNPARIMTTRKNIEIPYERIRNNPVIVNYSRQPAPPAPPKLKGSWRDRRHNRPTRRELIRIRRRVLNHPPPPPRPKKKPELPVKKKPGRKPQEFKDDVLKNHNFNVDYMPTDVESDYEGYLSASEGYHEKVPELKRSTSSDSIFLDMAYKDYRFDFVSALHNHKIHSPRHPTAKLRKRKMNRILLKMSLRYKIVQSEALAFKEMLECYHGNMPKLANEVARTKMCCRNPHRYERLKVPRVFTYGEGHLIDECSALLKEMTTNVVALEHASTRAGNTVCRAVYKATVERRERLRQVSRKRYPRLPGRDYLAMEFFFLQRIPTRNAWNRLYYELTLSIDKWTAVSCKPKYEQMFAMRLHFLRRQNEEFEALLHTQRDIRRHWDRTRKTVVFEPRSYQAYMLSQHERRLQRRAHAEKVAARKRLPTPERRELEREDILKKPERDARAKATKEIIKETKKVHAELVATRLRTEASYENIMRRKEARMRKAHNKRQLKALYEAEKEKHRLELIYLHEEGDRLLITSHRLNEQRMERERRTQERLDEEQRERDRMEVLEAHRESVAAREKARSVAQNARMREEAAARESERSRANITPLRIETPYEQRRRETSRRERAEQIARYEAHEKARKEKEQEERRRKNQREADLKQQKLAQLRKDTESKRLADLEKAKEERRRMARTKRMREAAEAPEYERSRATITPSNLETPDQRRRRETIERERDEERARTEAAEKARKEKEQEEADLEQLRLDHARRVAECAKRRKDTLERRERFDREEEEARRLCDEEERIENERYLKRKEKKERLEKIRLENEAQIRQLEEEKQREEAAERKRQEEQQIKERKLIINRKMILCRAFVEKCEEVVQKKKEEELKTVGTNLLKMSKDRFRSVYSAARNSFSIMAHDKLLFNSYQGIADILFEKAKAPKAVLFKYIASLATDPPAIILVPAEYKTLFENIASCYIYQKGDDTSMAWTFVPDQEALLKKLPRQQRKHFEPLVPTSKPPRINQSYQVQDVFLSQFPHDISIEDMPRRTPTGSKRKISETMISEVSEVKRPRRSIYSFLDEETEETQPNSTAWVLPEKKSTRFWKFIEISECQALDDAQKEAFDQEILTYIICNSNLRSDSVQWIFSLLGACSVFVMKKKKIDERVESIIVEGKEVCPPGKNGAIVTVMNHLITIASYFQEANKCRENLLALFEYNGFHQLLTVLMPLMRSIYNLIIELNLPSIVKPGTSIEEILTVIFSEVGDECERMIADRFSISPREAAIMRNDEDDTINYILENRFFHPSRVHRDLERENRINTIIRWYHSVQKHYGKKIELIANEILNITVNDYEMQHDKTIIRPNLFRTQEIVEIPGSRKSSESDTSILSASPNRDDGPQLTKMQLRAQIRKENAFPSRLPTYASEFVTNIWKTIERYWYGLNAENRKLLNSKLYHKFDRTHKRVSIHRMHMMIYMGAHALPSRKNPSGPVPADPYDWKSYIMQRPGSDLESIRENENTYLKMFKNIIVSQKEFRQLNWKVPRANGAPIQAIEFYTDLYKYRNKRVFSAAASKNSIPFRFNVFHHIWFMGALAPRSYITDSHEHMPGEACAGCTEGTVIIVTECTCEYHEEAERANFCFTSTTENVSGARVSRILGRFVCEHGPSSCLVLVNKKKYHQRTRVHQPVTISDRKWEPFRSRFTTFGAYLRVLRSQAVYDELLQVFPRHLNPEKELALRQNPPSTILTSDSSEFSDSDVEDRRPPRTPSPTGPAFSLSEKTIKILKRAQKELQNQKRLELSRNQKSRVRSRSAEPLLRQQPGSIKYFTRCCSSMNLADLNKYAEKKMQNAKNAVNSEISKDKISPIGLVDEEILNVHSLFNGISNATDAQKFEVIASMFECGAKDETEESASAQAASFKLISRAFKFSGMLQIVGEKARSDPRFNDFGYSGKSPVSIVTECFIRFLRAKEHRLNAAKSVVEKFEKMFDCQKNEQFQNLIIAYCRVWKFNIYLYEHFIDLAQNRIFNCYAVYQAEKTQNMEHIEAQIATFDENIENVFVALFNVGPLVRQLDDLHKIKHNHTDDIMACHTAALARYVLERVRVPRTVDEELNYCYWVNRADGHRQTFDRAVMYANDNIPSDFDEDTYLEKVRLRGFSKHIIKKEATEFPLDPRVMTQSLVLALIDQTTDFYETVRTLMPNGVVDRLMKIYYQNQNLDTLLNLLIRKSHFLTLKDAERIGAVHTSILISALTEQPKGMRKSRYYAQCISEHHVEMHRISAIPLSVYPSTMGISFACFKDHMIVSVVKENKVYTRDERKIQRTDTLDYNEEMAMLKTANWRMNLVVDKKNGDFYVCFNNYNNNFKNDRLHVAKLEKSFYKPKIDWQKITNNYLKGRMNVLNSSLLKRNVVIVEDIPHLGRSEGLISRRLPKIPAELSYFFRNAKDYVPSGSDSDGE